MLDGTTQEVELCRQEALLYRGNREKGPFGRYVGVVPAAKIFLVRSDRGPRGGSGLNEFLDRRQVPTGCDKIFPLVWKGYNSITSGHIKVWFTPKVASCYAIWVTALSKRRHFP